MLDYFYMKGKKNILVLSAIVVAYNMLTMFFVRSSFFDKCYDNLTCQKFVINMFSAIAPYTLIFLPLFLFSLITYKMRDEVSRAWMYFAVVWVPLSIIAAAVTPDSPGGGFGPQISIGKGDTAIVMSLLFVVISLIVIVWKYFATRGK